MNTLAPSRTPGMTPIYLIKLFDENQQEDLSFSYTFINLADCRTLIASIKADPVTKHITPRIEFHFIAFTPDTALTDLKEYITDSAEDEMLGDPDEYDPDEEAEYYAELNRGYNQDRI